MSFYIPSEVYVAMPYVIAMLLGAALPVASLIQYRLAAHVADETRLIALLAIVGAGAMLSVALTNRTLDESQFAAWGRLTYEDFEEGFAASRWLSLLVLGGAFVEIVRGWLRARTDPAGDPARHLLATLLLFYLGTIVIQGLASEVRGFNYKALYLPIVFAAVYYLRIERIGTVIEGAKWIVFVLCAASLAAAALKPDFVLHRPAPGVIPGIDWRLFGLTSHANTLGPVALGAILLELHTPSRRKVLRWLHLAVASAVLVLAQSKTAWGAIVAIALLVYVPLALSPGPAGAAAGSGFRRAAWTLLGCIACAIALAAVVVALNVVDVVQREVDVTTLTGRTEIWRITLAAWRENVLFGYGPEIWGIKRRLEFNMFHVGQAHNQVVQTLGEAGLFGLVLLLAYLLALAAAALRHFAASRGIVLAILVLVLARWTTEAPMRSEGILSWTTFMQALLLAIACHYVRQAPQRLRAARRRKTAAAFADTLPAGPERPGATWA